MSGYFHQFLTETTRRTKALAREIEGLDPTRLPLYQTMVSFLEGEDRTRATVVQDLFPAAGTWPRSIAERFSAIGEATTYRVFYARMSSETHGDAEETLRYFVATSGDADAKAKARQGTEDGTHLVVYTALDFFLRAAERYAISFDLLDAKHVVDHCRGIVGEAARNFVGGPDEPGSQ